MKIKKRSFFYNISDISIVKKKKNERKNISSIWNNPMIDPVYIFWVPSSSSSSSSITTELGENLNVWGFSEYSVMTIFLGTL